MGVVVTEIKGGVELTAINLPIQEFRIKVILLEEGQCFLHLEPQSNKNGYYVSANWNLSQNNLDSILAALSAARTAGHSGTFVLHKMTSAAGSRQELYLRRLNSGIEELGWRVVDKPGNVLKDHDFTITMRFPAHKNAVEELLSAALDRLRCGS